MLFTCSYSSYLLLPITVQYNKEQTTCLATNLVKERHAYLQQSAPCSLFSSLHRGLGGSESKNSYASITRNHSSMPSYSMCCGVLTTKGQKGLHVVCSLRNIIVCFIPVNKHIYKIVLYLLPLYEHPSVWLCI